MKRIGVVALIVLFGMTVWLACSREPTPAPKASGKITIGAIVPRTGPFAAYGNPVHNGMQLAVDEINSAGGVQGKQLEVIEEDDGGKPNNAVNAFTKLATIDKVAIVLGPLSSGASMATAPLADRYHVVQLSTLAGTIDLTTAGDYVFRIYPSSDIGSRYIANAAIDHFKAKRAAILYPNNALGVTSRRVVTDVLKQRGAQVVAEETYNDGDRDFRTQLTKIREAHPDVILASSYYEEGAQILVQSQELGITVPVLGEDGWFGPIAQQTGESLHRLYFANVAFDKTRSQNQRMQSFITSYERRYREPATAFAATGYSAVMVAKDALEHASNNGTALKTRLYATNLSTPFGHIIFDKNGDDVGATYDLYQLDATNQPQLVH